MKKIKKAVIPIGGMGTRFLPITKSVPKEMLPIIDKPIIHYIIEEAVNSGIEEILLITSSYKKVVEDYFDNNYELESRLEQSEKLNQLNVLEKISNMAKIYYIRQGEPLGTGHAILKAKEFVGDEPFAILFGDNVIKGDIPALKQLIDVYEKYDCNVIGVQDVPKDKIDQYGIIEYENNNSLKIQRMIEKPLVGSVESSSASLGRYILKPEIFSKLENIQLKNGEYYLTDGMELLMNEQDFYACRFEGVCYDTGNQEGYLKVNIAYAFDNKELFLKLLDFIKSL